MSGESTDDSFPGENDVEANACKKGFPRNRRNSVGNISFPVGIPDSQVYTPDPNVGNSEFQVRLPESHAGIHVFQGRIPEPPVAIVHFLAEKAS